VIELNGSLRSAGLLHILQLLEDVEATGLLRVSRVSRVPRSAELGFDRGRLVAVCFGEQHGLRALRSIVRTFKQAAFAFAEGPPPVDRNLDLTGAELHAHLAARRGADPVPTPAALQRVVHLRAADAAHTQRLELERGMLQLLLAVDGKRTVREIIGEAPVAPALRELDQLVELGLIGLEDAAEPQPPAEPPAPAPLTACPRLGFADDSARHHARPTGLHRCYASGSPGLVTPQEQRDLCLSGSYPSCPRWAPLPETVTEHPVPASSRAVLAGFSEVTDPVEAALAGESGWAEISQGGSQRWIPAHPLLLIVAGGVGLLLLSVLWMTVFRPAPAASDPLPAAGAAETQSAPAVSQPATVVPAPTATQLVAPAAAAIAPPTEVSRPVSGGGQTLMDARFVEAQPAWAQNPPLAAWADGAYRVMSRQARFTALAAPLDNPPNDVIVSATFRKIGGPPGGGYGLIVRDRGPGPRDGVNQDGSYYVFEVSDRGEIGAWRRDGDYWVDLLSWTPNPAVRQGGSPNDLQVQAVGDHLAFTVNGAELVNAADESPLAGGIGIFVGGDANIVAVDRFTVQAPD
jgi:hypothetical protein